MPDTPFKNPILNPHPGLFNLKVASLRECRSKWLDRKIDEARVEEISKSIESSPASMHNAQPWLAIADVAREDVEQDKNLVKGANMELIGGLHRRAAYKKVYRNTVFKQV